MPYIVNLSSLHEYSIDETVNAFVQLCDDFSNGCLDCLPGLFHWTNYAWVMAKFKSNYSSLIEPYKLGKISTEEFLDNLAQILDFMNDIDLDARNAKLIWAWNASIKLSDKTENRFANLVDAAMNEPVYIISNTNSLNASAILDLLITQNPDLAFKKGIEIGIANSEEPVEILKNVYLCLSYRYGTFKTNSMSTTMGLIEHLSMQHEPESLILVSQFDGDLDKGRELGFGSVVQADKFYGENFLSETSRLMVHSL